MAWKHTLHVAWWSWSWYNCSGVSYTLSFLRWNFKQETVRTMHSLAETTLSWIFSSTWISDVFEGKTLRSLAAMIQQWHGLRKGKPCPHGGSLQPGYVAWRNPGYSSLFFYVRCRYEMMGHCGTFCGVIWYIIVSIIYIFYHIISYNILYYII